MPTIIDLTDEQMEKLAPLLGGCEKGGAVFAQIFVDNCMRVDVFDKDTALRIQSAIGKYPSHILRRYGRECSSNDKITSGLSKEVL